MTMPTLTPRQLRVLQAAGRGEVSMPASGLGYDIGIWRMSGLAVTTTACALIARGLARASTEANDDHRLPLVVTAAGHLMLSKAHHRG